MKAIALAVPLFLATAMPAAAKTLTIGIDQSVSNPLMLDEGYAKVAAGYVRGEIAALSAGDWVHVRTFGERNAANFPAERIRITRSMRADKVADMVSRFVASLPSKALPHQSSTNVIAFLEFGTAFDCVGGGRVLLLTDGVESSAYINERELFAGRPLPAPDANILAGCEVTMLGFAQTKDNDLPPQAEKAMRKSWSDWMKTAGATFKPISNP